MTAKLASTNADNDTIGILVGWYVDPDTGREYTLSALRDTGGTITGWEIWYNYLRSDAVKLVDGSANVTFTGGWSSYPDGVTIQATRTGNEFTFVTTQLGNTTLDAATTLTLDLDSNPILDKFKGESPYGFSVYSQASSTFTVLGFTSDTNDIFDIRNGDLYTLNNGSWIISGSRDIWTDIGIGRFVHNESTGKTYYVANSSAVIKVAVNSGPTGPSGPQGNTGPQGPQVLRVHKDQQVQLVRKVLRVSLVHKVRRVLKDQKVRLVTLVARHSITSLILILM